MVTVRVGVRVSVGAGVFWRRIRVSVSVRVGVRR